jgi:hypothetical protein
MMNESELRQFEKKIGYSFYKINITMAKQKYYAVWAGRETGIFGNWEECKKSVE